MMADVYLVLNIPAIFTLAVLDKLLVITGDVDIVSSPATITPITQVTMVYCCLYLFLLAILMIVFMKIKKVIVGVTMKDVEVGLNR